MANSLQSEIDEINDRLDSGEESLTELSDSIDSAIEDVNSTVESQASAIDELEQGAGQLQFPLSQETIDLITEQGPAITQALFEGNYIGTAVLTGGAATITNNHITPNSLIMLSTKSPSGTPGVLSYVPSAGSAIINSTSGTDASTVIYFILTA